MPLAEELRTRTYEFAVRIVKFCRALPRTPEAQEIGRQLVRAGTSPAANYRAACRSRSRAEFIARLGIVVEELDETTLWLQLLADCKLADDVQSLLSEAEELLAILATSRKTAKQNRERRQITKSPSH